MNNNLIYSNEPCKRASYITEEGKFINLRENKINLIGYCSREPIHADLPKLFNSKTRGNTIRVNDGTYLYISEEAYIDLSEKEPTKEQYDALLKWLDFLMLNSKKKYLYIGIGSTRGKMFEFVNKTHQDGLLPEDIVKEIKKLYNK